MKQNPSEEQLRRNLETGRLSRDGFLGEDPRSVSEIIAADQALLASADLTPGELAKAMRGLTRKGMEGMGEPVETNGYIVTVQEYMGLIGCPFKDNRRAAKRNTTVEDKTTGRTLSFTDLSVHLIEAHGFFQGKGSAYRLEPLETAELLKISKRE